MMRIKEDEEEEEKRMMVMMNMTKMDDKVEIDNSLISASRIVDVVVVVICYSNLR